MTFSRIVPSSKPVFVDFRCNIVYGAIYMYYHSTQIVYVPHLLPLSFSLATILLGEKLGALGGGELLVWGASCFNLLNVAGKSFENCELITDTQFAGRTKEG